MVLLVVLVKNAMEESDPGGSVRGRFKFKMSLRPTIRPSATDREKERKKVRQFRAYAVAHVSFYGLVYLVVERDTSHSTVRYVHGHV